MSRSLEFLRQHFLAATILVVFGVSLFAGLQFFFGKAPIPKVDVAGNWNRAVARLGVSPVYPPMEDFYAGDLFASIGNPCWENGSKLPAADPTASCAGGFGNASARIAHIDLSDALSVAENLPIFDDTSPQENQAEYRKQTTDAKGVLPVDKKIHLSFIAFPDVSVSENDQSAGSSSWNLLRANTTATRDIGESVAIVAPMTYGASVEGAFLQLWAYCQDPNQKYHCEDKTVRKMLSLTIGKDVCKTVDDNNSPRSSPNSPIKKKYADKVNLQLVYRVYMSRQFDVKFSAAKSIGADVGVQGAAPEGAATPAATASEKLASAISVGEAGKFIAQRPLIFGYRAITIELDPSEPTTDCQ